MELSVIIPVYNEENVILNFLDELKEQLDKEQMIFELIVVNDGSTDKTKEIIQNNLDGLIMIEHKKNQGYGAAIKSGLKKAKFEKILIIDSDGSYPVKSIHELLKVAPKYNMVVGSRTGKKVEKKLLRRPAKWFLRKLAEYLSGAKIPDLNSGLRIFDKKIAEKYISLFPDGFSFTTTITLLMLCNNYDVEFIPIDYYKRIGKSKIKPIRDTANFLGLVIKTSLYFNPIKVFGPVSVFILAVGITLGIYNAVMFRNITTMTIIIFLAGLQIGMLGLLADLIDKRM